MQIAVVTDANYLPWCATLLQSCLQHHPEGDLRIHLVHCGDLAAEDRQRLASMVRPGESDIEFHQVDLARLEVLPSTARWGLLVWVRILLPDLLRHLPRVLYLDADTLVTDPIS